jgi:predicted transcriptional regulator
MNGDREPKTVVLRARCSSELALRLEQVAQASVARNVSDHIRFAIEQYVVAQERQQAGNPSRHRGSLPAAKRK